MSKRVLLTSYRLYRYLGRKSFKRSIILFHSLGYYRIFITLIVYFTLNIPSHHCYTESAEESKSTLQTKYF